MISSYSLHPNNPCVHSVAIATMRNVQKYMVPLDVPSNPQSFVSNSSLQCITTKVKNCSVILFQMMQKRCTLARVGGPYRGPYGSQTPTRFFAPPFEMKGTIFQGPGRSQPIFKWSPIKRKPLRCMDLETQLYGVMERICGKRNRKIDVLFQFHSSLLSKFPRKDIPYFNSVMKFLSIPLPNSQEVRQTNAKKLRKIAKSLEKCEKQLANSPQKKTITCRYTD